ncbi:macB1 [Symbiodinium microadriaticum]|nr:macB1 [Symbiodinium microadriaticum]
MTDPAVEIRALRFGWKPRDLLLDISELTIKRGERVFIYGPSGCGKSTLLGLIAGVLSPQSGSLRILGEDIAAMKQGQRDRFRATHMGVIFQSFNLLPFLSVSANVQLGCEFADARRAKANTEEGGLAGAASRLLAQLGLDEGISKRPATDLSVGQQQRVAVARALIGHPEILIADEPTSALDSSARMRFLNLLAEACETSGITLLFVSHDMGLADQFDRVIDLTTLNRQSQFTEDSFETALSGTDLLVGARSGETNLLLYAVFHLGDPVANLDWQTYQEISNRPDVAWTIPISLGDSFRGYRVIGTSRAYFDHYRYGAKQDLMMDQGKPFDDLFDAVLGAEVADALNLSIGDDITLSHGIAATSFSNHDDKPFRISGVLRPTGTPVDRVVHVSLAGLEAIHLGWQGGVATPAARRISQDDIREMTLTPKSITAFLVGMKSRVMTLRLQRDINQYKKEPLTAVLPGVALARLWQIVSVVETAMSVIAGFVIVTGLIGMLTALLTSLNERRREMALLRAVGAHHGHIFSLLVCEAVAIAITGAVAGAVIAWGGTALLAPAIQSSFGIVMAPILPGFRDFIILASIIGLAALLGCLPAWAAYRNLHMRMALAAFFAALITGTVFATVSDGTYQTLEWDDLMPEGEWELYDKQFMSLFEAGTIEEGSEQDQMIQLGTFNTVTELDGKNIRLPGFALPFEYAENQKVTEFLLVPYFGACIHAPPPPPNQIVYVKSAEAVTITDIWSPVWVAGTLHARKNENGLGNAAYTLDLEKMDPYIFD